MELLRFFMLLIPCSSLQDSEIADARGVSPAQPCISPSPTLLSAMLTLVCAPPLSHRDFHWQNMRGGGGQKKGKLILEASSETQVLQ